MDFVFIIGGLVFLVAGGNLLLKASVSLSLQLTIPKIVIGMTVVSLATSAPELIVSIKAALDGSPDLALGNVIGSNIANLALVLGVTLCLSTIAVEKGFYKTDWPMMMLLSVLLYGFIFNDRVLEQYEGIILLALLVVFLIYLLRFQIRAVADEEVPINDELIQLYKIVVFIFLGGLGLWGGSELLINGAKSLAVYLGVSERIIGLTVVSIGTSIPELAASVIAVIKKEKAISLGNLIGSNIFNIGGVLGITSIITPIKVVDQGLLTSDIFWMIAISFIVLPLVFLPKGFKLGWRDGIVLLGLYICFLYVTLI